MIRAPAVAGTWYPASASALAAEVDAYVAAAADVTGSLSALVAPHAGLKYSGPVAAHAYRLLGGRSFETIVLVGPSHFVGFDGVSAYTAGSFQTPLGAAIVDEDFTAALIEASGGLVFDNAAVHGREHSLEMQLPFIRRLAPSARIVPLLIGYQTADTATALARALVAVARHRHGTLLVASSDLSHYRDAHLAQRLDAVVLECLARFDADALQDALNRNPEHACGGGPMVAVLKAARLGGASAGRVLAYGDSGDVSGDKHSVVGYAAAAFGAFDDSDRPHA